jgi:GMP synthase (glutamine-hydrolysing)
VQKAEFKSFLWFFLVQKKVQKRKNRKGITMNHELIIVLDFGGQYNQLIARRVRECNVYCEIMSYRSGMDEVLAKNPKGIILTGGPNSVYTDDAATIDPAIFDAGVPVLGICYGSQLMSHLLGGRVCRAPEREYGKTLVNVNTASPLFQGVSPSTICWMSHNDYIEQAAPGFEITATTANCPVAAVENQAKKLYAVQFHPEVLHTAEGTKMLSNFVYNVCGCVGDWKMDSFVETSIQALREKIGDGKVLCALSGGVDSSVLAAMLAKAIGKQLTCVFVDHGLLRKNEMEEVCSVFGPGNGRFDINFICVNARQRYYEKLAGVEEPEAKRKIIGEEFIRVFEEEAKKIGRVDYLAQGTIYPDVVESGLGGESTVIKSHHNVGGLPDYVDFKEIVEPLRNLFKDEVRQAGRELGLPEYLVSRQPFPGPGLAIRIIGDVTEEKVKIVQDADAIWREEIGKAGLAPSQYYAALTNMRSVGVMGDERTYDYAIALRAVTTTDFMTAEATPIPWEVLSKTTNRIVNEVKHVNRVMYDCTSKPPATIEFE